MIPPHHFSPFTTKNRPKEDCLLLPFTYNLLPITYFSTSLYTMPAPKWFLSNENCSAFRALPIAVLLVPMSKDV